MSGGYTRGFGSGHTLGTAPPPLLLFPSGDRTESPLLTIRDDRNPMLTVPEMEGRGRPPEDLHLEVLQYVEAR